MVGRAAEGVLRGRYFEVTADLSGQEVVEFPVAGYRGGLPGRPVDVHRGAPAFAQQLAAVGFDMAAVLREGEAGLPVAEVIRKHGVSRNTYFKWKSKYGGSTVAELRRLLELEAENAKLKRMYADLALENTAIKDLLSRKL